MKKSPDIQVTPWEVTADMFLSEAEVGSLRSYLQDQASSSDAPQRAAVDKLIVEILLFSGLRNSELCHLRVADTAECRTQSAIKVSGTPKQDRLVYIPRSLCDDIAHYVKSIRPKLLPKTISAHDANQPLILNERGKSYDRTALYRRVVRILTDAGLADRASVQLLRHTYGFLAYKRSGGNLLFVQKQLGHAHPMVTAVYAQFVEFSYSDLADRVGGQDVSRLLQPKKISRKTSLKKKD